MLTSGLRLWLDINGPKWVAEEVVKKKEEPERFRSVSVGWKLEKETNAFVGGVGEASH